MLKYKAFLYKLFTEHRGWQNRKTLMKAISSEIHLVLRILFCISVGHIPIRRQHFSKLIKSKKRLLLADLRKRFRTLQHAHVKEKREFVTKFSSLYPSLFEPLFKA